MFNFKEHSTVKWKPTITTPMHALIVCRLDPQLDETGLAIYLLENGIPFDTLQLSTMLSWSPLSTHPPLILPSHNTDYESFWQQCHVIFKQPRGLESFWCAGDIQVTYRGHTGDMSCHKNMRWKMPLVWHVRELAWMFPRVVQHKKHNKTRKFVKLGTQQLDTFL